MNHLFLGFLVISAAYAAEVAPRRAVAIQESRLDNAHRLTANVLTGAEPHGEPAMSALKELGVKTLISVDGAKPDVELAHKFGLNYVHLPIGYEGVSPERSAELAKALVELDGPIYVHCHHGKHRGPAAAATACVVAGMLNNDEAIAAMKKLGTGENYPGLWESARNATPLPAGHLAKLKVDFKEISPIPQLADDMVRIEELTDLLAECKSAGWKAPKDHRLPPEGVSCILSVVIYDAATREDGPWRPADFRKWMNDEVEGAQKLKAALYELRKNFTPERISAADAALTSLQENCKACHKVYRNVRSKP